MMDIVVAAVAGAVTALTVAGVVALEVLKVVSQGASLGMKSRRSALSRFCRERRKRVLTALRPGKSENDSLIEMKEDAEE